MSELAVSDWAGRIRPHLVSAAESIIAAGRELVAAKEALPHGEFGPLLAELALTPRTAQRFMAIARNPVLSDATHVSHLPSAWGTLYELSRLPAEVIEEAIEGGEITPGLTREDVAALSPPIEDAWLDPRMVAVRNAIAEVQAAAAVIEAKPAADPHEEEARWRQILDLAKQCLDTVQALNREYDDLIPTLT